MKTTLALCLALLTLGSARAQIFRPEALNGALLGGIAGAVIGNNSGDLRHNAWKGAAIGAGAGLILGEAIGNARASHVPMPRASYGGYVYRHATPVHVEVGYRQDRGYRHRHYGYGRHSQYGSGWSYGYAPGYSYHPGYGAGYPYYDSGYYGTRSAAANGLLLGALAGGIVGHNSGEFRHNGWRGAAWGAGAGWLLGSVIDANRRAVVYEAAPVVSQPAAVVPAQPVQPAPQQVTIINNYYNNATPMSGANSLFGR
jgi:uncharacterized protein YcfJ